MKKTVSFIMALVLSLSMLTACGDAKTDAKDNGKEEIKEEVNVLADKSLEDILAAIYKEKKPEFPLMDTKVDLADENAVAYSTGLSKEDSAKVKEALASEPAMGSQAYSLVLLRLNDAKDAEAIAAAVKSGVDPRKWICVEADDIRACASGDVVMFVMMSTVFADSITSEQMVEAFKNVAEGSLSVDLK